MSQLTTANVTDGVLTLSCDPEAVKSRAIEIDCSDITRRETRFNTDPAVAIDVTVGDYTVQVTSVPADDGPTERVRYAVVNGKLVGGDAPAEKKARRTKK